MAKKKEEPSADGAGAGEAPALAPEPERLEVMEWARRKGHIAPKGPFRPRENPHRGKPDIRWVRVHTKWTPNQPLTEDQYDAGVRSACSIQIGENLADRRKRKSERADQ